jgi:predicted TIM-barrel fold metal-dependent hydrolase
MTYAGAHRCADADSHLMEEPGWLESYADPSIRDRLTPLSDEIEAGVRAGLAKRVTPSLESEVAPEALLRSKAWAALGALDGKERSTVLDALGFEQQIVFPTFAPTQFMSSKDDEIRYGGIDALNRGVADVCADDPRLLAVGTVSLANPERACVSLERALGAGCRVIWVPTAAEGGRSPAHVVHDPFWARLAEAGVPFVCHVGSGSGSLKPAWHDNGRPLPKDHFGGGENLRSKDFPSIHHTTETFLSCLVLDGVFERFGELRCGVIELGASWVPGFLRNLDAAARNFSKFEPMLADLSLSPSDYIRRQVKFTPYPFDDIGWLIDSEGDELFLFSSDYPHPEGGRDPLGRFERSLDSRGIGDTARERFYAGNFDALFGPVSTGAVRRG